jgi:hypothetical protein
MRGMFPDMFPPLFRVGISRRPDIETCSLWRPHPEGVSRGNILSLDGWKMFPEMFAGCLKKS